MNVKRFPSRLICPTLAEGEFLVYCSYDNSHCVINHQYSTHLDKCRKNYVLQMEKNGTPAVMVHCRINPKHQVYSPELPYHEYNCPTLYHMLVEDIYFKDVKRLEAALRFAEAEEERLQYATEAEIDEYLERVSAPLYLEPEYDLMASYLIKLIKKRPSRSLVQEMRPENEKKDVEVEKEEEETVTSPFRNNQLMKHVDVLDQTRDPEAFGYIYRKPLTCWRRCLPKVNVPLPNDDPDSEELIDWGFEYNGSSVSSMEHGYCQSTSSPSDLTKNETMDFEEEDTPGLVFEDCFFSAEEDEQTGTTNYKDDEFMEFKVTARDPAKYDETTQDPMDDDKQTAQELVDDEDHEN